MDCRTCQPTLLDLAYGELAPELAQVVRAHVDGCDSCGAALKALQEGIEGSQQLSWLEPPPALSANIMAYATQHAAERAQAVAAAKARAKPHGGFVQVVLDFIGRMASGRQFAMATVFVLVVTVGVWVIPELQPLPEGQGVTVVSPDSEGEAAPSGGLAPAEPLDLTVDQRSRRIRSREEIEAAQLAAKNNAMQEPADEAMEQGYEPSAPAAVAAAEQPAPEQQAIDQDALRHSPDDLLAMQERRFADSTSGSSSGSRKARSSETEAFPANDVELAAAPRPRAAAKPAPVSAPQGRSIDDLLDGSLSSGSGSKAKSAEMAEPEASIGRADKAVPSLERARIARKAEGCAAALPAYEQAVSEYSRSSPQSSVLGQALLELAECQYQLGRESAARATLKRASSVTPVAVRARALLGESESKAKPAAPTADEPEALRPAAMPSAPSKE